MKDDVLKFTENLSELLESGIDLPKSLFVLSKNEKNKIACELNKSINEGEKLSSALMNCQSAFFPEWYVGFILASENGGNLVRSISHLTKALKDRQILREKFIGAVFYPLLIAFLTAICGFIAVFSYSSFFEDFQSEALKSCLFGGIFLAVVAFLFVLVLKKLMNPNPCASLFNSLGFLTDSGVPIISAIDNSMLVVEKSPSLSNALIQIRSDLMGGCDVSSSFSNSLSEAGFNFESNIAKANLSISETSGKTDAFFKIAKAISKRTEKIQNIVLSSEQPVLLCVAAVYLVIILKSTVMKALFPDFQI